MARSDDKIENAKREAAAHYARIREAGGALSYCIDYVHHIAGLKDEGEPAVIRERGAAFPRTAVRLAAGGAVQSARSEGVDSETMDETLKWARAAWVHSAGHYVDQPFGGGGSETAAPPNAQVMAIIRKAAETRKAKAAEQWDRLVDSDVESLATLALFGREAAKPVSRKDRWIGNAILAGLTAAGVAYGLSNSYLSVKVDQPFDSELGFQQHRDATARVLNHTTLMSLTVPRSGILKLAFGWPMRPTEDEREAFTRFGREVVSSWRGLAAVGDLICGGAEPPEDDLLEIIRNVNDGINLQEPQIGGIGRYESLIIRSLLRTYPAPAPCQ